MHKRILYLITFSTVILFSTCVKRTDINRIFADKFTVYTTQSGLSSNEVHSLAINNSGQLLM